MPDDDNQTNDRIKSTATQIGRELPPLLNIEHQELIRAVERAQIRIADNHEATQRQISDLARRMDDRYDMQTKALDAAFAAQTTAMDTALAAADKAIVVAFDAEQKYSSAKIHALTQACAERSSATDRAIDKAFLAAEESVKSKMEAADRAVSKAEAADGKRFEAVNEFRAQLNDVITTLMPRNESEAKYAAMLDKISDVKSTVDSGFSGSRATQETTRYAKEDSRGNIAIWVAAASVLLTIVLMVLENTAHIGPTH